MLGTLAHTMALEMQALGTHRRGQVGCNLAVDCNLGQGLHNLGQELHNLGLGLHSLEKGLHNLVLVLVGCKQVLEEIHIHHLPLLQVYTLVREQAQESRRGQELENNLVLVCKRVLGAVCILALVCI